MWCINIKKRISKSSDLGDQTANYKTGEFGDIIDCGIHYIYNAVANKPSTTGGAYILSTPDDLSSRVGIYIPNIVTENPVVINTSGHELQTRKLITDSDLTAKIGSNIKKINYDWDDNNPKFLVTDANGATFYAPLMRK